LDTRESIANSKVSFIIPNWNQKQLLHESISSIYNTIGTISYEIIIVDNASIDESVEYIQKSFPDVIFIRNSTNLGYAKAVNQGVTLSKGDFIFLLNNDTKLLEGTTERLLSFLNETADAGAVAPVLYYPDGKVQASCRIFPTPSALLLELFGIDRIGPFRRWKMKIEEHLRECTVPQPMASALMIKRECWNVVGPMDERFPLYFNDVDWCYRLYKNTNYKIYLYPEAKAIHHYGASTGTLGHRKKIEFYKGLLIFYFKHFFPV